MKKKIDISYDQQIVMPIFLKKSIPNGCCPVIAAHAAIASLERFRDRPETKEWLSNSFAKSIKVVSDEEFQRILSIPDSITLSESQLGSEQVVVALPPTRWNNLPRWIRCLPKWKNGV